MERKREIDLTFQCEQSKSVTLQEILSFWKSKTVFWHLWNANDASSKLHLVLKWDAERP